MTENLLSSLIAAFINVRARPEKALLCFVLALASGLAVGLTCLCGRRCAEALLNDGVASVSKEGYGAYLSHSPRPRQTRGNGEEISKV